MSVTTNVADVKKQFTRFVDTVQNKLPVALSASTAEVFYEQARVLVPKRTGKLRSAIYRKLLKDSREGFVHYFVSWNHKNTEGPHGRWMESGWKQRYKILAFAGGKFRTKRRADMRGKPKPRPSRKERQAVYDSFYELLPQPINRQGKAFIVPAYYSALDFAKQRARAVFAESLRK